MNEKNLNKLLEINFIYKVIVNSDNFILFLENDEEKENCLTNNICFQELRLTIVNFWLGYRKDWNIKRINEDKALNSYKLIEFIFEKVLILSVKVTPQITYLYFEKDLMVAIDNSYWSIDNIEHGNYHYNFNHIITCKKKVLSVVSRKRRISDKIKSLIDVGTPNNTISYYLDLSEEEIEKIIKENNL